MEETQQDVETTPSLTADADTDSSSVISETSTANGNAGDVIAVDAAAQDDPLKDIPSLEELQQQAEQKVPYAAGLARLRAAYESVTPDVEQFKSWKEIVTTIADPTLARDYHEAISGLRVQVEGNPNEFTSRPGLDKLESISPGITNQIFYDLLSYEIPDENGRTDTMVRHMYRSHGLDPDRIEDYRNIDTIRASGAVTSDDLAGIPERFHSAFRALSSAQRDDFILQKDTNGQYSLASMEYLQDKAEALEARQWREQQAQSQQQAAEQQRQAFEAQLEVDVIEDITGVAQSIHDSILENMSSPESGVTFSSDPTQDYLAKEGILSIVANIQSPLPYQKNMALNAFKKAGIELNGYEEKLNILEQSRAEYVRQTAKKDVLHARRAKADADIAEQQVRSLANDYALRLAKVASQRVAGAAAQQNGQLAAATARYVPSGSQVQNGSTNPYEQNPHPVGSQEYYAFNRKLDREYKLTGASMFG